MAYRDLLLTLASDPEATPPAAIDLAVDFAAAIRARISAIACEVRIAVPGSFLSPALVDVGSIAAADEKGHGCRPRRCWPPSRPPPKSGMLTKNASWRAA